MPQQNFNSNQINGSLFLGDSNTQPTVLPVVSGSTDGLAIGSGAIAATGSRAIALGNSRASGADSIALQIGDNTTIYGAQAANTIAMGYQAKATSASALAIGQSCTATSFGSTALGYAATAQTGSFAVAIGRLTVSAAFGGIALGVSSNVSSNRYGVLSHAAGQFSASGDAQESLSVARIQTSNATPTSLLLDGTTTSLKCGQLNNSSAWVFEALVVGKTAGAGNAVAFKIAGLIKRGANAAATSLVGSPTITVIAADAALASATASVNADTTNGALDILVSGIAATTMTWVGSIKTAEVTF